MNLYMLPLVIGPGQMGYNCGSDFIVVWREKNTRINERSW